MDLSGLNSNPLKKICRFKESIRKDPLVKGSEPSLGEDSIAHFRKNSNTGEIEVRKHIQKQKLLNDSEKAEVIERYQAGESTYQLAEAFGCHRKTISGVLKKAGIDVNQHRLDDQEAIRLYESGLGTTEIAKRLDSSQSVVSRALRSNGVKMRSSWETRKLK